MRMLGIIAAASLLASFTDWLFMDLLVHAAYTRMPQLWRPGGGTRRIVISQLVGTLASAATVLLCAYLPGRAWLVAGAMWCGGALPVTVQYWQWMPMERAVAVSHAAGWLARIAIAGCLAAWLLA